MRLLRSRPSLSAALLLVLACGDDSSGPSTPVPSLILYTSGAQHLNVLDLETSQIRQLTSSAATDEHPALSPDGARVVFSRGGAGATTNNLYLINLDGTGETALTTGNLGDTRPSWSPNGQEIVFERSDGGAWKIMIIRPDGTGLRPLLATVTREYHAPSWSPTGEWIALMGSNQVGDFNIYLARPDGSSVQQLTNEPGIQEEPAFSPDGEMVAYSALSQTGEVVKLIRPDGTGTQTITPLDLNGFDPAWNPEGDRLVFVSLNDFTMYTVGADGTGLAALLDGQVQGRTPNWAPRP